MELQVGDIVHWVDGCWDKVVIYRGKSFWKDYHWFDFLLENPDAYPRGGFHTKDYSKHATVIGHIPGVLPY